MKLKYIFAVSILGLMNSQAVTTTVFASNVGSPLLDNSGVELLVGDPLVNSDGDLFEIGYFTGDTATFTGDWVAITGSFSANSTLTSTIGDLNPGEGDVAVPAGVFSTQFVFDTTNNTANDLPPAGGQLAIRFYDGATPVGSNFNTVTAAEWVLGALSETPDPSTFANLDLADSNVTLVFEDSASPFQTSIVAVPEPSTSAILGLGGFALLLRRRR